MAINLGGGGASAFASLQISSAQDLLSKSLRRISSGKRITSPADDPVGLAVSMKLQHAITITGTTKNNVDNAQSYVDTQDSALEAAGNILDRMSTLRTSYGGAIATSSDKASYAAEFKELSKSLSSYASETFNGISLFAVSGAGTSMKVYASTKGDSGVYISMGQLDVNTALTVTGAAATVNLDSASGSLSISSVTIGSLTSAITNVATLRATSGATSSRLQFSSDFLSTSKANLEAANSRVMDVDIAEEVTNYAKYSVQLYAASAALAQSNLNLGIVLDLLNASSRS
jgi:flagellin